MSIALFEAIVVAGCFSSFVVNMDNHFSELNVWWEKAERISSILTIERVRYILHDK